MHTHKVMRQLPADGKFCRAGVVGVPDSIPHFLGRGRRAARDQFMSFS